MHILLIIAFEFLYVVLWASFAAFSCKTLRKKRGLHRNAQHGGLEVMVPAVVCRQRGLYRSADSTLQACSDQLSAVWMFVRSITI